MTDKPETEFQYFFALITDHRSQILKKDLLWLQKVSFWPVALAAVSIL
jgi:hypothetical protein